MGLRLNKRPPHVCLLIDILMYHSPKFSLFIALLVFLRCFIEFFVLNWISVVVSLQIYFKKKKTGGISFNSTIPLTHVDEKLCYQILHEYKIHNAEVPRFQYICWLMLCFCTMSTEYLYFLVNHAQPMLIKTTTSTKIYRNRKLCDID